MTHDREPLDDAILVRFLNGEATADETACVRHWLSASEENRAELDVLRAAWTLGRKIVTDPDDSMWRWISARMDESGKSADGSSQRSRARTPASFRRKRRGFESRPGVRVVSVAAVATILLGGGALLLRQIGHRGAAQQESVASTREVTTRRAQRAMLDLADGSHVVLAAGSRLRIPDKFGAAATARDLYLDGEGYFEVTHDARRPFRVITSAGITQDVGTHFVVTALPETKGLRVVVAEGAVAIYGRDPGKAEQSAPRLKPSLMRLAAGEMGFVDSSGLSIQTSRVNVDAYTSWTRGELVYDGSALRDVIPDLMRWYDLDIVLGDSTLARLRLSATFRDEAPDEMLRLLETALDLRIERHGRSLTLYPRTHHRPATSASPAATRQQFSLKPEAL